MVHLALAVHSGSVREQGCGLAVELLTKWVLGSRGFVV